MCINKSKFDKNGNYLETKFVKEQTFKHLVKNHMDKWDL